MKYTNLFLKQRGFKLFIKDEEILTSDIGVRKRVASSYKAGKSFFEHLGEAIVKMEYPELLMLGYAVIRRKVQDASILRIEYDLVRNFKNIKSEDRLPENLSIECDLINSQVRLKGINTKSGTMSGVGRWYPLSSKNLGGRPKKYTSYEKMLNRVEKRLNAYSPYTIKVEDELIQIPEIPMLVTYDNKIVCLSQDDVAPKIGFIGRTGEGNSFLLHRLCDQAFSKWGVRLALLNDKASENFAWVNQWKKNKTIPQYKVGNVDTNILNEETTAMPIVALYQQSDGLMDDNVEDKDISFKIALGFQEVMQRYDEFFAHSLMEMKGSKPTFNDLIYDKYGRTNVDSPILKARSLKDIYDFFESIEEVKKSNRAYFYNGNSLPPQSVGKIKRFLKNIFTERIFDISCDTEALWTVEYPNGLKKKYNPIIACLTAGLVPALETYHISTKSWFPFYYRDLLNKVADNQISNPYFRKNNIQTWVVTDELTGIINKHSIVDETISNVWRESRPKNLGMVFRSQHYDKILDALRYNYGYYFCTRMVRNEAKDIIKDTEQDPRWVDVITNLNKFEVVAIPKTSFVTYDRNGVRREEERAFHGIMLPPNSEHLKRGNVN